MLPFKGSQVVVGFIKKNSEEVQNLKEILSKIEKKEKYLRSLVLQHQTNIAENSNISQIWELSSDNNGLDEKSLNKMQSVISQCELVSAHQVTSTKMEIAAVEESEDVKDGNKVREEIEVMKLWNMEGKIEEIAYSISFRSASSSNHAAEPIEIEKIALSATNAELEQLKQTVMNANDMQMFTLGLHSYQLLVQEQDETMDELEEFENMEVQRSSNPLKIIFMPVKDYQFTLLWKIVWDEKNLGFKNEIWVDCNDDVVARFSQKEDAYPYLKGEKLLSNKKKVIQFFGQFVD